MAVMEKGRWTDERIDDLKVSVDKGFIEVKEEFGRVRPEIRELKGEVRELRSETNTRFDSMQRTMIIGFASIVASVVGAVIAGLAFG
jgi:hypothetical protein